MGKRLIRIAQVEQITSFKKSTIYDRLTPDSSRYDPTFPRPMKINGSSTNVWVEEEVYAWVDRQIEAARGDAA